MRVVPEQSLGLLEASVRIGVAGSNFKAALAYLLQDVFKDAKVILLDLNDEFSCVARMGKTRYYDVVKYGLNPIKPPNREKVEQYIESVVEILDYCFGTFNVKAIAAKALLDDVLRLSETTIPEIASRLDFETPEGGLSIYTPFEPFTFGTLRQAFGRKEAMEFSDVLESGMVFNLSGFTIASHKVFATLLMLAKLAQLEPKRRTLIVVSYPSLIWPRNRRLDNAKLFVEESLTGELERKGYSIIFAEKNLSQVSERVLENLDSVVFSPPSEAVNPWRMGRTPERDASNYFMLILIKNGEYGFVEAPVNIFLKPLSEKEREARKPVMKVLSSDDELRERLGEFYEAGSKIIGKLEGSGGKASLNEFIEEVRASLGAEGLRALAALIRQGYLRQVQEGERQLLVLAEGRSG
ncbi:MAG: hypothetical protein FGF51_03825 [Candidatus Brockarchaeota archaeon]|nr:hypothetical protein [Candidatus Brockarchaeota archaeon]